MISTHTLFAKGSTGTGRGSRTMPPLRHAFVEFEVEAVGATPTLTFTIEGLIPGGNTATAGDWASLATVTTDASAAVAAPAAIVVTAVGKTRKYIAGLDQRGFDAFSINVTANTNVTYSARLFVD